MAHDGGYTDVRYTRIIKHTLDDGTILAAVVIGQVSEPAATYRVRTKLGVLYTPRSSGPPGRDIYTDEELEAHRGAERFVMDEHEKWSDSRITNDLVAAMTKVRLVRVWETDMFDSDGKPVYKPEFKSHV